MADIIILKTGRLYEADMLADALQKAGVPHYRREEHFSGLQEAMPALPMPGPGIFFTVVVPEVAQADAREILSVLPIEPGEPGFWHYGPRPWARRFLFWFAVLTLGGMAIGFVYQVAEWLMMGFR